MQSCEKYIIEYISVVQDTIGNPERNLIYDIDFKRSLAQTEDLCVTLKICVRHSFHLPVGSDIRFDQKIDSD